MIVGQKYNDLLFNFGLKHFKYLILKGETFNHFDQLNPVEFAVRVCFSPQTIYRLMNR